METIFNSNDRVVAFFDEQLKSKQFTGVNWDTICRDIINELPQKVYISFDVDGLSPDLCPNTGTPVPGGLSFEQAVYLIKQLVSSGRTIIGFDLCEVGISPTDWDANVGARLLYHLCNLTGASNGRMPT
jgi:agmatinase